MAHQKRERTTHEVPTGDLTWAALEAALGPPCPSEPPAGAITVQEFAARYGITENAASNRLHDAWKAGKLRREIYKPAGKRQLYAYLPVTA